MAIFPKKSRKGKNIVYKISVKNKIPGILRMMRNPGIFVFYEAVTNALSFYL